MEAPDSNDWEQLKADNAQLREWARAAAERLKAQREQPAPAVDQQTALFQVLDTIDALERSCQQGAALCSQLRQELGTVSIRSDENSSLDLLRALGTRLAELESKIVTPPTPIKRAAPSANRRKSTRSAQHVKLAETPLATAADG
jgi:hypothetical protein